MDDFWVGFFRVEKLHSGSQVVLYKDHSAMIRRYRTGYRPCSIIPLPGHERHLDPLHSIRCLPKISH